MGLKYWWKTGAAPNDYEFGLAEDTFQGQPVAYLRSIVQPVRSFGAFCQTIAAEDYRGKRIRFSAALKATKRNRQELWIAGAGMITRRPRQRCPDARSSPPCRTVPRRAPGRPGGGR
jgi:hypothetical protein